MSDQIPQQFPVAFCRVPDHLGADRVCLWPDGDIGWAVLAAVPGVSEDEYVATFSKAHQTIAAACNVDPHEVRARDARILADVRRIDGMNGVLAESELPCGRKQCRQWYDLGENWLLGKPGELVMQALGEQRALELNERIKGIYLYLVMLHELLHAYGLGHAPQGVRAVIAPVYNSAIIELQEYDIEQLARRYGRRSKPVPIPQPDKPSGGGIMGGIVSIIKLFAQLAPLIDWFVRNKAALQTILDVLKQLAETFAKQPAPQAVWFGLTKDQFRSILARTAVYFKGMAEDTAWEGDNLIAELFEQAVTTDWLLDFLYGVLTGGTEITEDQLAVAWAETILKSSGVKA